MVISREFILILKSIYKMLALFFLISATQASVVIPSVELNSSPFYYHRVSRGHGQQNPQHQTWSLVDLLRSHGIGFSGNLGIGLHYSNGDSSQSKNPNFEVANPSPDNTWDRYLGTYWHLMGHLHTDIKNEGAEEIKHKLQGIPAELLPGFNTAPNVENRADLDATNSSNTYISFTNVTQPDSNVWQRFKNYLISFTYKGVNCTENTLAQDRSTNCSELYPVNNPVSKFITRYLSNNEPRNQPIHVKNQSTDDEVSGDADTDNKPEIFLYSPQPTSNKVINKYFQPFRPFRKEELPKNQTDPVNSWLTDLRNEVEGLKNVIKLYLAERLSTYLAESTNNEQFIKRALKKSLLQSDGSTEETTKDIKLDPDTSKRLSKIFSIERILNIIPEFKTLKDNLKTEKQINNEEEYQSWFHKNIIPIISKYRNQRRIEFHPTF